MHRRRDWTQRAWLLHFTFLLLHFISTFQCFFSSYISFLHFNAFPHTLYTFHLGTLKSFLLLSCFSSYYFLLHFTIFLSPTFNNFVLPPTSCNIYIQLFHFTTCGASLYISSHGHVKHDMNYADNRTQNF